MKNNKRFQHRMDKVTKAEVTCNANRFWQLSLETIPGFLSESEIVYEFNKGSNAEDIGCFVGTTRDGAAVNCYMHPGNNGNHGGYGGQSFILKMKDGSLRTIRGPWSGRPGVHINYGAPDYMLVNYKGYQIGLTINFVQNIIDQFNLEFVIKTKYDVGKEKSFELAPK